MDSTKLPDLNRLNRMKKRIVSLPSQSSALDTSNWEGRNVSAPIIDLEKKIESRRNLDFMIAEQEPFGVTLDEAKKILKEQGFSPEQIQQKLDDASNAKKWVK